MRARAGLPDTVNSYSDRHSLGRWMEEKGVPDKQISFVLGHERAAMKRITRRCTERPANPTYLREATASIEEFVHEIAKRTHVVDLLVPPPRLTPLGRSPAGDTRSGEVLS